MNRVDGKTRVGGQPGRLATSVVKPRRYKRVMDLTLLAAVVVLGTPVWVILALLVPLAIWIDDRGPVFFRQERVGRGGRTFTFLKFRTMVVGAESEGQWTREHDPRVTRTGKILRRIAVDELPQLVNILNGEMSWVGPRPLPTRMHEEAVEIEPRFSQRLQVTPGATGVAQLHLPRHTSPRRRLRYDLLYVKKMGFWLDVRLILGAARFVLTGTWGEGRLAPEQPSESGQSSKAGSK